MTRLRIAKSVTLRLVFFAPLPGLLLLAAACSGAVDAPAGAGAGAGRPTFAATEQVASVETPGPSAPVTTTAPPAARTPAAGVVSLYAVGDVMLARDLVMLMDLHGSLYPFEALSDVLSAADITIANLEGTFTERGFPSPKFYTFRTPPRHAAGLAEAGIDVVSLGNNHTLDFGRQGLEDTLAALEAEGIAWSGAGLDEGRARQPAILEANGIRVAFLSYNGVLEATFATPSSPGVARAGVDIIRVDVAAAGALADIVVVSLHAGLEYTDPPTQEQQLLARSAIDAGALLVLGHHPHVLQGWERYGNGLIVYSLGNFVFDLDSDDLVTLGPYPFETAVLQVELTPSGVLKASALPVLIDPGQNRPLLPDPDRAVAIELRIEELSSALR